jgi:hypothetical protein
MHVGESGLAAVRLKGLRAGTTCIREGTEEAAMPPLPTPASA